MKKVFKGVIHSLLPQKGYGFIKPGWAKTSEDNIYFYLPDTKIGHKCFIPALQAEENRTTTITKSGTKIVTPIQEQNIYFELEEQLLSNGVKRLKATNLTDDTHTPEDIKEKAATNSETRPNLNELSEDETPEVEAEVETIPEIVSETVKEDIKEVVDNNDSNEPEAEEEEEESYDTDYSDDDSDGCYADEEQYDDYYEEVYEVSHKKRGKEQWK